MIVTFVVRQPTVQKSQFPLVGSKIDSGDVPYIVMNRIYCTAVDATLKGGMIITLCYINGCIVSLFAYQFTSE
jgi:hypothetical protein